ncbi:MAG TPA: glutathione S-transferase family protein [Candidatus Eisenbacteria bacterium]|nr:glutathione S-transferase family protein [Candidatus Eisenbacteria bacterium]
MRTLYVGNKNYSSWSLRAWLLLRQLGVDFEEKKVELFADGFRHEVAKVSPAGLVPVLVDDGFAVWDTLAIAEWIAERCPEKGVWPAEAKARARARSICAEMHAGFSDLRHRLPMNLEARLPGVGWSAQVARDVERITSMWSGLRAEHRADGPFLFGAFGAADAFYAPVVTRFVTYDVEVPRPCAEYMKAVLALSAMREWTKAALAEKRFIPEEEPYRTSRDA